MKVSRLNFFVAGFCAYSVMYHTTEGQPAFAIINLCLTALNLFCGWTQGAEEERNA